jgi:hypothetical protein
MAKPAIVMASTRAKGSSSMQDAVLEGAGLGLVGVADEVVGPQDALATASHLRPVGKAAPPRPTSLASVSSRITAAGPMSSALRSAA